MSTYVIGHECGHQITYNLAGKVKDREWRAERLRAQVCDACYRALRVTEAQIAGREARNALEDAAVELPPLVGSEKQVTWAADLRAQQLVKLRAVAGAERLAQDGDGALRFERVLLGEGAPVATRARIFAPILATAVAQTNARWWIDRRRQSTLDHLRALAWAQIERPETLSAFADAVGYALREHIESHDADHHTLRSVGLLDADRTLTAWMDASDPVGPIASRRDLARRWWAGVYDVARPAMVAGNLAERLAPPMEDL
jgi:hypothetical protein